MCIIMWLQHVNHVQLVVLYGVIPLQHLSFPTVIHQLAASRLMFWQVDSIPLRMKWWKVTRSLGDPDATGQFG